MTWDAWFVEQIRAAKDIVSHKKSEIGLDKHNYNRIKNGYSDLLSQHHHPSPVFIFLKTRLTMATTEWRRLLGNLMCSTYHLDSVFIDFKSEESWIFSWAPRWAIDQWGELFSIRPSLTALRGRSLNVVVVVEYGALSALIPCRGEPSREGEQTIGDAPGATWRSRGTNCLYVRSREHHYSFQLFAQF